MRILLASLILSCAMFGAPLAAQQTNLPAATGQPSTGSRPENYDPLLDLPPLPHNTVTLIGGTVSALDEVMNKMSVQPFGQKKPMQIAFDTRTHFFQDGHPISHRDIRQGQRVYVDTMLNGDKVFAKQIWIQTTADSGLGRGQIVAFDPKHQTLTVRDELSSQDIKMRVTSTTVIRNGSEKASAADLVAGSLISMQFGPQHELREVILSAKPGSAFTFAGPITYLDLSRKLIAIDNTSDRKKYDIAIDAIAPSVAHELHQGDQVSIDAVFDGSRYAARQVNIAAPNQPQQP